MMMMMMVACVDVVRVQHCVGGKWGWAKEIVLARIHQAVRCI